MERWRNLPVLLFVLITVSLAGCGSKDEQPPAAPENLTATAYTDTNVTSGKTYFYQVTAENSDGESNGSAEVSATPQ
jgi:fibronectin type 3 domain-containing protein